MTTKYDVTISVITKSAPSDGFIDPYRIDYYRAQPSAEIGTDMATMVVKKKGFARWHRIENQLQRLGNIYISNIVAPDATTNAVPSSIAFRAFVEHGSDSLLTPDENTPGVNLTGTNAIKRAVARALISSLAENQEVWDPTLVVDPDTSQTTDVVRFGYRTILVNVGALCADLTEASGHITVTAVD